MWQSIKATLRRVQSMGNRAAATNADTAYRLQLSQFKIEQNQFQLAQRQHLRQQVRLLSLGKTALIVQIETLQRIIANQNAPKGG